jgi:hypothetical protein
MRRLPTEVFPPLPPVPPSLVADLAAVDEGELDAVVTRAREHRNADWLVRRPRRRGWRRARRARGLVAHTRARAGATRPRHRSGVPRPAHRWAIRAAGCLSRASGARERARAASDLGNDLHPSMALSPARVYEIATTLRGKELAPYVNPTGAVADSARGRATIAARSVAAPRDGVLGVPPARKHARAMAPPGVLGDDPDGLRRHERLARARHQRHGVHCVGLVTSTWVVAAHAKPRRLSRPE